MSSSLDTLASILAPILESRPSKPFDLLSTHIISQSSSDCISAPVSLLDTPFTKLVKESYKSKKPIISATTNSDDNSDAEAEANVDDEEESSPSLDVPNFSNIFFEQSLLHPFGYGLPPSECSLVQSLVSTLSKQYDAGSFDSLRLFGKFLTITSPLYVVEAIPSTEFIENFSEKQEEEETEKDKEDENSDEEVKENAEGQKGDVIALPNDVIQSDPIGEGVNKFIYFVYLPSSSKWVILPLFKPLMMTSCHVSPKFLKDSSDSFNLSYLRTVIAIISHSTVICPKGLFTGTLDEETEERGVVWNVGEEEVVEKSEFPGVDPSSTCFVHRLPKLMKNGRVKKEEEEEGEEEEEQEDEEEERDVVGDYCDQYKKGLSQDLIDRVGLQSNDVPLPCFRDLASNHWNITRSNDTVFAKNVMIPGSVSAMKRRFFVNFYCGYGVVLKNSIVNFTSMVLNSKVLAPVQFPVDEIFKFVEEVNEPTPEEEGIDVAEYQKQFVQETPEEELVEGEVNQEEEEKDEEEDDEN
ncbi:hypothetical protein RCL1_003609 [Eukaryota sp. TZLM3-RCL]